MSIVIMRRLHRIYHNNSTKGIINSSAKRNNTVQESHSKKAYRGVLNIALCLLILLECGGYGYYNRSLLIQTLQKNKIFFSTRLSLKFFRTNINIYPLFQTYNYPLHFFRSFFTTHSTVTPRKQLARSPSTSLISTTAAQPIQSRVISPIFVPKQQFDYFSLGENLLFGINTNQPSLYSLLTGNPVQKANDQLFASGKIKTVFLLVMEDHQWSQIFSNYSDAPYINLHLLPQASYATHYYNPLGLHPSEPNYIWLEAGSNVSLEGRRFTTDDDPSFINSTDAPSHLVTLLQKKGISWRTYIENINGNSCPTNSNGLYTAKHNPTVFFTDVTDNTSSCISHERPFSDLPADLHSNNTASYNILIPNVCNDMHDSCEPVNNPVKQGDLWLAHTIPGILQSESYKKGGLLLIVWDEGANNTQDPIGMIGLSPYARGNGYSNAQYYTHSSVLKTIEEIFNVPLLRDSANAKDLSDLFIDTQTDVSTGVAFLTPIGLSNQLILAQSSVR